MIARPPVELTGTESAVALGVLLFVYGGGWLLLKWLDRRDKKRGIR